MQDPKKAERLPDTNMTITDASVTPKAPAMPMKTAKQIKKAAMINNSRLSRPRKKP